jgi:hypothetical protein
MLDHEVDRSREIAHGQELRSRRHRDRADDGPPGAASPLSGLALLDKAGWVRFGAGDNQTHPQLIALTGVFMLFLIPLVWALLRRSLGMPMFGKPTIEQIEEPPANESHI